MATDSAMTLEVRDVSVELGGNTVLDRVSLEVPAGTTAVITGPSGAGKTTLLRTLAGLQQPSLGNVAYAGVKWNDPGTQVATEARSIGFVFQDLALWPHLSVAAQIEITLHALSRSERSSRVAEVLDALDIVAFAGRYPMALSGGQQQRVALARALARKPQIALLDEPVSQLDQATSDRVIRWIRKEQSEGVRILIVVTHSLECVDRFAAGAHAFCQWHMEQGRLRNG